MTKILQAVRNLTKGVVARPVDMIAVIRAKQRKRAAGIRTAQIGHPAV